MGHFGGMGDLRDMGGRETSGSSSIFDEDLTRPVPPMSNLTLGPQSSAHFSSGNAANTQHGLHGITAASGQGSAQLEDGLSEAERMTLKRDKNAIYA